MPEPKPVLIPREESQKSPRGVFPVDAWDEVLEQKRDEANDGVIEAVRLLLSEPAAVIYLVDTTQRHEPYHEEDETPTYRAKKILAFNDHRGGSESNYKILVNQYDPDGNATQYILFSPPQRDGIDVNTTFHRANFTNPTSEPSNDFYTKSIPNPLKTASIAALQKRNDYAFYLFGGSETSQQIIEVLQDIGFTFDSNPYDGEEYSFMERNIPVGSREHWPGEQFAGQIAMLETVDYS